MRQSNNGTIKPLLPFTLPKIIKFHLNNQALFPDSSVPTDAPDSQENNLKSLNRIQQWNLKQRTAVK